MSPNPTVEDRHVDRCRIVLAHDEVQGGQQQQEERRRGGEQVPAGPVIQGREVVQADQDCGRECGPEQTASDEPPPSGGGQAPCGASG
jgi:hypothetical protein